MSWRTPREDENATPLFPFWAGPLLFVPCKSSPPNVLIGGPVRNSSGFPLKACGNDGLYECHLATPAPIFKGGIEGAEWRKISDFEIRISDFPKFSVSAW